MIRDDQKIPVRILPGFIVDTGTMQKERSRLGKST
jgi:hypothetical protein